MTTALQHIGIGFPVVRSLLASGSIVRTSTFELCSIEGNPRKVFLEKDIHELLEEGEHAVEYKGVRSIYTLDYSFHTIRNTLTNMRYIWNDLLAKARGEEERFLQLQFKSDVTDASGKVMVYYSGESLEFLNETDIEECTGVIGLKLEFTETKRSTKLIIPEPYTSAPHILPTGPGIDELV